MSYEMVAEKLRGMEEQELFEVAAFIDFMHFHRSYQNAQTPKKRFFGMVRGKLSYPDDIDEDNEVIAEMFGV